MLVDKICENKQCKKPFKARKADIKRGWGRFCSKSCKAIKQEQYTHQCANYHHRRKNIDDCRYYQEEYGGEPQFNNKGEFIGICIISGEDDHDCNKE